MKKIKGIFFILFIFILITCVSYDYNANLLKKNTLKNKVVSVDKKYKALNGCDVYGVGVGVGDMTLNPSNQLHGGYIENRQKSHGVHTRLKARSFIIVDKKTDVRNVLVVLDNWLVDLETVRLVSDKLSAGSLEDKFGKDVSILNENNLPYYNYSNIMLIASHTHCGVAGTSQRHQYNISAGGYDEKMQHIVVDGVVDAILMAHQNITDCTIEFSRGDMIDDYNISKNRSIRPHLSNTEDKYIDLTVDEFEKLSPEDQEKIRRDNRVTDKTMYLLKFKDAKNGKDVGCINWFSIHPTSLSASHNIVSGDNKAVSQIMFEEMMGVDKHSDSEFVAGFAQATLGDVGSNRVIYDKSKFGYTLEEDMENVNYSARAQAARALELYMTPQIAVKGPVLSAQQYTSMDYVRLSKRFAYKPEKYMARTVPPASGLSMGVGSEINRAALCDLYDEGQKVDDAFIKFIRFLLVGFRYADTKHDIGRVVGSSKEYRELHQGKPVLLASGNGLPSWVDLDIPFQIFRIGNIVVVGEPFETTTASGRKIRRVVKEEFEKLGYDIDEVICSGNTNGYISYMATPDEFELQYYEGASTIFGINQVQAVQQEMVRLVNKMDKKVTGRQASDPEWVVSSPRMLRDDEIVKVNRRQQLDRVVAGKSFGEQRKPLAKKEYKTGETFSVEFYSSNLNSDIFINSSYFYIQRYDDNLKSWVDIADDDDFNTTLKWTEQTVNYSYSTVIWRIPYTVRSGKYRVVYQGVACKSSKEKIPYTGVSEEFNVVDDNSSAVAKNFVLSNRGKKVELSLSKAVNADMLVLRLGKSTSNSFCSGVIKFDNGTSYPVRKLGVKDYGICLYFPDRMVENVSFEMTDISGKIIPTIEKFELYNSDITNETKVFELECR